MSGPPCKAVLCLAAARAAANATIRQVEGNEYNKEEEAAITECADRFLKDLVRISEG